MSRHFDWYTVPNLLNGWLFRVSVSRVSWCEYEQKPVGSLIDYRRRQPREAPRAPEKKRRAPRQLDPQCCYSPPRCRRLLHPPQHGCEYLWLTAAANLCPRQDNLCALPCATLLGGAQVQVGDRAAAAASGSKTQTTVRARTAAYHLLAHTMAQADTRASNLLLYNIVTC